MPRSSFGESTWAKLNGHVIISDFVLVDRTSTEPNEAKGPVWFLSWVGQAHQLWGEEMLCLTAAASGPGTGGEKEGGRGSGRGGKG